MIKIPSMFQGFLMHVIYIIMKRTHLEYLHPRGMFFFVWPQKVFKK